MYGAWHALAPEAKSPHVPNHGGVSNLFFGSPKTFWNYVDEAVVGWVAVMAGPRGGPTKEPATALNVLQQYRARCHWNNKSSTQYVKPHRTLDKQYCIHPRIVATMMYVIS